MATVSREDLARRSKEELLSYIEQQSEQLVRFEARFRDVVRAYKGLLKEKEALESSLRAIGGRGGGGGGGGSGEETSDGGGVESGSEGVGGEGGEPSQSESEDSSLFQSPQKQTDDVASLKQRVATLTSAMATLTEEREKMKGHYQSDKKAMLTQQDSLVRQMQAEREEADANIAQLQEKIQETQHLLRTEQLSRESEQATHADMLRELQSLIAMERDSKEALSLQLKETEQELERVKHKIAEDRTREYEEKVHLLSQELEELRHRLQAAEVQAGEPSPFLLKLQSEMNDMKESHSRSIQREQQRANEAEKRLRAQAQQEEQRVASLENKLSELSETVGNYDRQREIDQAAILKLKDRIAQLDSENTALTRAHVERKGTEVQISQEDVATLQERVARLKAFLKIATLKVNEKASLPSNVEEMSVSDYAEMIASEPSRKDCQQELFQLKEEFERYKTRAQSVLRSKGNKEADKPHGELKELQSRNNELRVLLDALQGEKEEAEERQLLQAQRHRDELLSLHDKHKHEIATLETQYKQRLQDLQQHTQTTRHRTMKLLEEKDAEIQHLRSKVEGVFSHQLSKSVSNVSMSSQTSGEQEEPSSHEGGTPPQSLAMRSKVDSSSAVQELLDQPSPAHNADGQLLHYIQEQNRRDNELSLLRRKRIELEDSTRELQEREQRLREQTTFLKEDIRKLERDRSRETENLEYLKNVVFHYMCAGSSGREQMLSPIATILHFSPDEVSQVKRRIASKRWLPRVT